MQHQAETLGLQQCARMGGNGGAQRGKQGAQIGVFRHILDDAPSCIAQNRAMFGGGGDTGAKQTVDIGQAAARDEGERALQLGGKPVQQPAQMRRYDHSIRCFGKVEKCPVYIQKDSTTTQPRSLRRAIIHTLQVAVCARGGNPRAYYRLNFNPGVRNGPKA